MNIFKDWNWITRYKVYRYCGYSKIGAFIKASTTTKDTHGKAFEAAMNEILGEE